MTGTVAVGVAVGDAAPGACTARGVVGALPIMLGIHQLTKGLVWLALRGGLRAASAALRAATEASIIGAHAVLPAIVPLGFAARARPSSHALAVEALLDDRPQLV